jgi:riboflavin synthase
MFTGIVEIMGRVQAIEPMDNTATGGGGFSIIVGECKEILDDCHLGDSIAVNGVCLTVTEFSHTDGWFKIGVAPETLRKTNLGDFVVGQQVNLERAMGGSTRFGGHFVQGHVDTTVTIREIRKDPPNSLIFRFGVEKPEGTQSDFLAYIVPKGYVALDGTSLTVIDVDWSSRTFSVMLIAYTQTKVILPQKKEGDKVNLEVDQVGKYVENMVRGMLISENGPIVPMIENIVKKVMNK